jgi:alpha-amylase/alpha-mannosidase (GH57 family)
MDRFICIHGHFYQPPRENPWIEEVEVEDTAYPFHDWNGRVTAECYAPNTASRILDSEKRIIDIVNNYSSISFDFGPTLLTWLERNNPEVYSSIIGADHESILRFSGHGSAIAQAYNHMIMPLANLRDKRTQVIWGIRDFRHRFGRMPEGMWLPETAVDLETLEIMAEQGILFTILSPDQADAVRSKGEETWSQVSRETLDHSVPYTCNLPGGRSIAIFFYDNALAQDVAFSSLLENGDVFAGRILDAFSRYPGKGGLISIASDGETYGHHHRFADMALAYALYRLSEAEKTSITIFGEYLARHPPTREVRIRENTSWSCPHGIERWRSNCGCCTRGTMIRDNSPPTGTINPLPSPAASCNIAWTQEWRGVLRSAMDRIRDELIPVFENGMAQFTKRPWEARDDYIGIILDRSPASQDRFFSQHAVRNLSAEERSQVLKLLEMQRHAMLMYTSCGWFFDDISGIEALQVLKYSCRAIQLAREITGMDLEPYFITSLLDARSNVPDQENGAAIYRNYVQRSVIDPTRVVFNFALSSLIDGSEPAMLRHYAKKIKILEKSGSGDIRMLTGVITLHSEITGDEKTYEFAVFPLGPFEFMGGVREFTGQERYDRMRNRLRYALRDPDMPRLISSMTSEFGTATYSLWHLFKDAQREILFRLLEATLQNLESSFRQIYRQHITLIHAMQEMQIPVPEVIENPVGHVLNRDLNDALQKPDPDLPAIRHLVNEIVHGRFLPDRPTLGFTASNKLTSLTRALASKPDNTMKLQEIIALFTTLAPLSLNYDLWKCQNDYFYTGTRQLGSMEERAAGGDAAAVQWISHFRELGTWLGVKSI